MSRQTAEGLSVTYRHCRSGVARGRRGYGRRIGRHAALCLADTAAAEGPLHSRDPRWTPQREDNRLQTPSVVFCQTRRQSRQKPETFLARPWRRGFRKEPAEPAGVAEPTHEGTNEEACWVRMWCIVRGERQVGETLRVCGFCGFPPGPPSRATLPRPGGQHSPPTAETTPAHPHTRRCEVLACAPPHRPPTASAVDICRLLRS